MDAIYLYISNLIVIVHFLFILLVLFGGLLVLRWPKLVWLHLPIIIWGFLVELNGWFCPLTPWENHFRELAGAQSYQGDFIGEYLLPLIYPAELTREMQYSFAAVVLILNAIIYYFIWRNSRKS